MTTTTNKPAGEVRDGNIRVTIWRNPSDKGVFYSAVPSRTYTAAGDELKDADSFTNGDILRLAHLLPKAYDKINELRADDRAEAAG